MSVLNWSYIKNKHNNTFAKKQIKGKTVVLIKKILQDRVLVVILSIHVALPSHSTCHCIVRFDVKTERREHKSNLDTNYLFWLTLILQHSPVLHHSWKSQQCWLEPSLTALCPTTDALVQTPLESDFLGMRLLYYQGRHLNRLLNMHINCQYYFQVNSQQNFWLLYNKISW